MNRHLVFKIIISIWTHGNMQITVSGSANLSMCNTEVYSTNAFCLSVIYFINFFFFFYLEAIPHHNLLCLNLLWKIKQPLWTEKEKLSVPINGILISEQINRQVDQHLSRLNRLLEGPKFTNSILAACIWILFDKRKSLHQQHWSDNSNAQLMSGYIK